MLYFHFSGIEAANSSYGSKGASMKNFCHACGFWPLKGCGEGGLSESVKKEKFVTKIFFSDNVE